MKVYQAVCEINDRLISLRSFKNEHDAHKDARTWLVETLMSFGATRAQAEQAYTGDYTGIEQFKGYRATVEQREFK